MTIKEAYKQGYLDGIEAYAHWKDGTVFVGTAGRKLKDAKEKAEDDWHFMPPREAK